MRIDYLGSGQAAGIRWKKSLVIHLLRYRRKPFGSRLLNRRLPFQSIYFVPDRGDFWAPPGNTEHGIGTQVDGNARLIPLKKGATYGTPDD